MTEKNITLGGRALPVLSIDDLTFVHHKKLLPLVNRISRSQALGHWDEGAVDDIRAVLCIATGMEPADMDALPGLGGLEIIDAYMAYIKIAGYEPAEAAKPGEAVAVATGTGTNSTPISPPVSDGPGMTSTG